MSNGMVLWRRTSERRPDRAGGVMRGENEPASGDRSDAYGDACGDAYGGALEDEHSEPVHPHERGGSQPTGSAPVSGCMKRLSVHGKVGRALLVGLAVIVALAVLALRSPAPMPPQIVRLLTPAPTRPPRRSSFPPARFRAF